MEYFASPETGAGPNNLPANPCKILNFSLLKPTAGEQFSAQTDEREVLAVTDDPAVGWVSRPVPMLKELGG